MLTSEDGLHDFTVDELDAQVSAEAGQSAVGGFRADAAGRYTSYCSVPGHREAGMEGVVVVNADVAPAPDRGTLIEVHSLTKDFGVRRAVDGLSFTAPAGQVTGFLGPNGAGKTTTLRCLLGLAEPSSGAALIDGRRYRELPSARHHVGAVLESTGFHPARTGRNHLRVVARAASIDRTNGVTVMNESSVRILIAFLGSVHGGLMLIVDPRTMPVTATIGGCVRSAAIPCYCSVAGHREAGMEGLLVVERRSPMARLRNGRSV